MEKFYVKSVGGYGRFKFPRIASIRGRKIKELERQGIKLYDTEEEAKKSVTGEN